MTKIHQIQTANSDSLTRNVGPIERTIPVDDPIDVNHKNLIVEFKDDSALTALEPLLPMVHTMDDEGVVYLYNIRSLANEYAATVGGTHTERYLKQISEVATSSGKSLRAC